MKQYILSIIVLLCGAFNTMLAQGSADPDVIEFAVITDTHNYGPTADERVSGPINRAFVEYCNTHPELSFALHLGDMMNAYDTNHDQALWCLKRASQDYKNIKIPFYSTKGNHDCNGKQWRGDTRDNSQIVTNREYYDLFSPLAPTSPYYRPEGIVTNPADPCNNYYYRDFEQQHFRLIVLNDYDRDSLELYGYHGLQMKWIAEQALDFTDKQDPEEWCFMMIGHAFSINHTKNPINRLLHAYVNGQDFIDADLGVNYGAMYSRVPRARCVALLGGHFHESEYWNWDGYNIIHQRRSFSTGGEEDLGFSHFRVNTRTYLIEDQRIGHGQSRLFSYDTPRLLWPSLAFPAVDGMGIFTQAGNGGRIVRVTNLNDAGPGSLRWAVEQKGCRTIVFEVGGTIQLKSPLVIQNDSVTIAGQTSPNEPITLAGAPVHIRASEVIVRYLTLKTLLTDGDFGQHNLVLDHLTTQVAKGSAIALARTEDVTVQECLFEGQPGNTDPVVIAGGYKATYYKNLWRNCHNAAMFSNDEGTCRWLHMVRNVFVNWGEHCMYGGNRQGEVSLEQNYCIPGPQSQRNIMLDVAEDGTGRFYVDGNELKGLNHGRKQSPIVQDRVGLPYRANPADTLERPKMNSVQRPHAQDFAKTCLLIAAFHNKPIFKHPNKEYIYNTLKREAGSGYRPQPVCLDSLRSGDVEGYARRLVVPELPIVILFENDVHSATSGYPYLSGLQSIIAADTAHVAITSSGDYLNSTAGYELADNESFASVMGVMNYDAITLGNQELGFSQAHARHLLGLIGAPTVCANLVQAEQDSLQVKPYVIQQYGRRRVAFVGATLSMLPAQQQYDMVQQAVDAARSEGAHYVILLSHIGEKPTSGSTITSHMLVANTSGIDAVLDGHSHTIVPQQWISNKRSKPVLLAQTGARFKHIGKLVIDPDGNIYSSLFETSSLVHRDSEVALKLIEMQQNGLKNASMKVGEARVNLRRFSQWGDEDRSRNAINAGDLVTDAMRHMAYADMAWLNPGSVHEGLAAGPISRANIHNMCPYQNELYSLKVKGSKVIEVITTLMQGLHPKTQRVTPISGLRIELSRHKKTYQVKRILVLDPATGQYNPIEPNRTYTVALTDYMLNMLWDKKQLLPDAEIHNTGYLYGLAVAKYIMENLNGIVDQSSIKEKNRLIVVE